MSSFLGEKYSRYWQDFEVYGEATEIYHFSFISMEFRLINDGWRNAYENMAVDEAILMNNIPTLRLYKWKPSAISIGYFQSMEEEVNLEECKRQGVDVVRRITGGGAVYHDSDGEITYSVICPQEMLPRKIMDIYSLICSSLAQGLAYIGLNARHEGINDIVVNGKKISGSALTKKYGNVLQHGTLLLKVDIKKMFSLLKVGKEKISDKEIRSVEERVTSVEKEGGVMDEGKVKEALIKGFEEKMGLKFYEGELTEKEREDAEKLREKYESREWNFKR